MMKCVGVRNNLLHYFMQVMVLVIAMTYTNHLFLHFTFRPNSECIPRPLQGKVTWNYCNVKSWSEFDMRLLVTSRQQLSLSIYPSNFCDWKYTSIQRSINVLRWLSDTSLQSWHSFQACIQIKSNCIHLGLRWKCQCKIQCI